MISNSLYKALHHKCIRAVFFNENGIKKITNILGEEIPQHYYESDARKTSRSVLKEIKAIPEHKGDYVIIGKSSMDNSYYKYLESAALRSIESKDFQDRILS